MQFVAQVQFYFNKRRACVGAKHQTSIYLGFRGKQPRAFLIPMGIVAHCRVTASIKTQGYDRWF